MGTREFLSVRGIDFEDVNVGAQPDRMAEVEELGFKALPVVAKGGIAATGHRLQDVAGLVGVNYTDEPVLSPQELIDRYDSILAAAQRYMAQLSEEHLGRELPFRDQSVRKLCHHILHIAELFLFQAAGGELSVHAVRFKVDDSEWPAEALVAYGGELRKKFRDWWKDWDDKEMTTVIKAWHGPKPMHQAFERTNWHSCQHLRQLMKVMEMMGVEPDGPLGEAEFEGLPLPENIWID